MEPMTAVNVFSKYQQDEDRFTNGLISLLSLSKPGFVKTFLADLLHLRPRDASKNLDVQVQGKRGRVDAELSSEDCRIRFETKIVSGCLGDVDDRNNQVHRHLSDLKDRPGRLKRLVLLTPDDSQSNYVRRTLSKHKPKVLHLEWRSVYDYLDQSVRNGTDRVFSALFTSSWIRYATAFLSKTMWA